MHAARVALLSQALWLGVAEGEASGRRVKMLKARIALAPACISIGHVSLTKYLHGSKRAHLSTSRPVARCLESRPRPLRGQNFVKANAQSKIK